MTASQVWQKQEGRWGEGGCSPFVSPAQVKGHCHKCSLRHRNILAKTPDQAMVSWFLSLMVDDPAEYRKVLESSGPECGQRKSRFSLTQYREKTKQKKIRGEEQGMELMDFSRYIKFHCDEVWPESERMTKSEARASWLRDLQGPDFERREIYSKKSGKTELRDFVWEKVTGPRRFKRREEEESRSSSRIQESNGSETAIAAAQKRLASTGFVNLDVDDTEFFTTWLAGFSRDESVLVSQGSGDSAAAVTNRRNKTRKGKASDKLVDLQYLRTWLTKVVHRVAFENPGLIKRLIRLPPSNSKRMYTVYTHHGTVALITACVRLVLLRRTSCLTKLVTQIKFVTTAFSDALDKAVSFENKYEELMSLMNSSTASRQSVSRL